MAAYSYLASYIRLHVPWQSSEELAETKMPIVLNSSDVENVTKSHIISSHVNLFVYLWW